MLTVFFLAQLSAVICVSRAMGHEDAAADVREPQEVTDPAEIIIPKEHGFVSHEFNAGSGRLVINIQDAHCNVEVQANISKIIEGLVKDYGFRLIAVEGADGAIDTSRFNAFKDEVVRGEVAKYFLKRCDISGPEFLSITKPYPVKLFGAETGSYYMQNLRAFTSSYPMKDEVGTYLYRIKAALDRLKSRLYSEELKAIDRNSQGYWAKDIQFNNYAAFLSEEAARNGVDLSGYPNLSRLIKVLGEEKKVGFAAAEVERAAVAEKMNGKLSKDEVISLATETILLKLGRITHADYYLYLKNLCGAHGIDIAGEYPALYRYIVYCSDYALIDSEKLLEDVNAAAALIRSKLFVSDEQRRLERLSRHIELLIGLANIRLADHDFEYYKAHISEFDYGTFAGFIGAMSAKYGMKPDINPPSPEVRNALYMLGDFYDIAMKRDKALVDNTLSEMARDGRKAAVLVAGGFHSPGIMKALEKAGVSYMVVCPTMTKTDNTSYIQALTARRLSFEEIVMGVSDEVSGHGILKPPSTVSTLDVGADGVEIRPALQGGKPEELKGPGSAGNGSKSSQPGQKVLNAEDRSR